MRVVAGTARGRRIRAPRGRAIRPTSDRVREAIFNALTSLGTLDGAVVADLFAGTGAMGIEALSRGAAHATFVDDDRTSLEAIRANLALTGLSGRAAVVRADAVAWAAAGPPVDLAIADPPYAFTEWPALLAGLRAGVVVLEAGRPVDPGPDWRVLRRKQYGSTVVTVAEPAGGER